MHLLYCVVSKHLESTTVLSQLTTVGVCAARGTNIKKRNEARKNLWSICEVTFGKVELGEFVACAFIYCCANEWRVLQKVVRM